MIKKCSCFWAILGISALLLVGCIDKEDTNNTSILYDLRVNHIENPLDVPADHIDFSWKNAETRQGAVQKEYQIQVYESVSGENRCIWDSQKVASDRSCYIAYEGEALEAGHDYSWQVTIWDELGKTYQSDRVNFRTAPAENTWEKSKWIGAPMPDKSDLLMSENTYQASFDMKMDAQSGGFVFQGDQGEYGYYKYCEFDSSEEYLQIDLKEVRNKQTRSEQTVSTKIVSDTVRTDWAKVDLLIDKTELCVRINGENVAQFSLDNSSEDMMGALGFYHGRSTENMYFDNFSLWDSSGKLLLEEDFEGDSTIFGYKKKTVQDGILIVRHQYVLTNVQDTPAPKFMKKFSVADKVKGAYLHISSMGIYETLLNGESVGENYFTSGRQSYKNSVLYDTYDITSLLSTGDNAIGIVAGHGYFDRGGSHRSLPIGVRGMIVLEYEDGTMEFLGTDESWKVYLDGPIREDDMYNGEVYDARYQLESFGTMAENLSDWDTALVIENDLTKLPMDAYLMEQMAVLEEVHPISVTEPEKGTFVYDFGEEFSGIIKLQDLTVPSGDVIRLQFAELLNDEKTMEPDGPMGTVWQDNLFLAQNCSYYIGDGTEKAVYEQQFTCTCFRYLQITGLDTALTLDAITAKKIASDLKDTGTFTTSNEKLNQLYENIVRSQKNNFLDMPSDCPQRDERYGWTGDAQVFARTASYQQDTYYFYDNFLKNLTDGQRDDGAYPDMVLYESGYGENGWGDSGVTVTWYHYLHYGDPRVIEKRFASMCHYVDYLVATSDQFIRSTGGYGDHNSVTTTPEEITSTAQSAYSCLLLSKMADVIGRQEEAQKYETYFASYKDAFQKAYIAEDGTIECWTQAAYALTRAYDLAGEWKDEMGNYLANCVAYSGHHLNTGYIATPFLLPELVDAGFVEDAYKVLLQETYPSWFYQINQGGTTIFERWPVYSDQEVEDFRFSQSYAHVAFGSVGEFFYRYILGIEADENSPGFKHFILQPTPGGRLSYAKGSYDSNYGRIESSWEKTEAGYCYRFTIPANSSATVRLPGAVEQEYVSGTYEVMVHE